MKTTNTPKPKLLITIFALVFTIALSLGALCACNDDEDSADFEIVPNLDFAINDTLENGDGQHVKVVILAGQSNATGCAHTSILKDKVGDEKFAEYEAGYDNVYINYNTENGRNKSDGFVRTNPSSFDTFGPEIGLAEALNKTNESYFIIKYAYGGSSMQWHWRKDKNCLFQAMTAFVNISIQYLESKNYVPKITSFLWMQGESDATNKRADLYYDNTMQFVSDIRSQFGDNIKFVDAGISDSKYWKQYEKINNAKISFSNLSPLNVYIDTLAEGLTYHLEPQDNPDLGHYDSLSQIKLGQLFAQAILN